MGFTFNEINDATGFARGDLFEENDDVRDYFTVKAQCKMFGDSDSQVVLDEMAADVIRHRWHMKGGGE